MELSKYYSIFYSNLESVKINLEYIQKVIKENDQIFADKTYYDEFINSIELVQYNILNINSTLMFNLGYQPEFQKNLYYTKFKIEYFVPVKVDLVNKLDIIQVNVEELIEISNKLNLNNYSSLLSLLIEDLKLIKNLCI